MAAIARILARAIMRPLGADRQVAQQPGKLTRIKRLGGGLELGYRPPSVTVDDGCFLIVEAVGQHNRAADPELEKILLLPVTRPVEAEVSHFMPDRLTELIGPRADAGFLPELAGGRL